MTERKVLNKYFPPDYDPSKIPRMRRGDRRRQFNIRTMAPFNMRCLTCNGYIYKAKKFNSRMETAENVDYLGLRHYRFYIRCPSCCAEIIWRTDLENGDYVLEGGAKRNFEALKTAEELEAKRQAEEEEELANNPMKMLEKRTDQSKQEMEMVEVIEDLKQLNQRQAGMEADHLLLRKLWQEEEAQRKAEEEADEQLIKELMASRDAVADLDEPEAGSAKHESSPPDTRPADIIIPKVSLQTVSLEPKKPPGKASTSYLKRQLQGAVLVKNSNSTKPGSSVPPQCISTSMSTGPSDSKLPKLVPATQTVGSDQCCPLPGMTYSDHSDSD
ncbi:Coiled-coil domain-containing protein 94 [Paragonimus heterotremus]|uniref:Splicing factor YJU2 n=1 Tax=Paragonimus heterotremus TaxID=100268 RepID=A0A8J4WDN4_9TREM|nr:Coiled-coil domain-containing protein 94 [Paragonimus heterotremus]